MVDYRKLRPGNLNSPEFKHLLLLLYWPVYGAVFCLLERGLSLNYHAVEANLDAKIPFCEFFVFPYYFWFVFLVGIHLYTLFFDIPAFKKLMYFIMITYPLLQAPANSPVADRPYYFNGAYKHFHRLFKAAFRN